jgi:hypothetical protein
MSHAEGRYSYSSPAGSEKRSESGGRSEGAEGKKICSRTSTRTEYSPGGRVHKIKDHVISKFGLQQAKAIVTRP